MTLQYPQKPASAAESKGSRCALLVATPQCEVEFANADARQWLQQFFTPPVQAGMLPRQICRWLAVDGGKAALVTGGNGLRLVVRRYIPHPEDSIALLLELVGEKQGGAPRRYTTLSRRENEVLGWIAAGEANRDVAEILELSPKTVGKHVERILVKLGVENRTSAATLYLASSGVPAPAG